MKCVLCEKEIGAYDPFLHDLQLNEAKIVRICSPCIESFLSWQRQHLAKLFPTRAMKKMYGLK